MYPSCLNQFAIPQRVNAPSTTFNASCNSPQNIASNFLKTNFNLNHKRLIGFKSDEYTDKNQTNTPEVFIQNSNNSVIAP
jgi:hypothetical protein